MEKTLSSSLPAVCDIRPATSELYSRWQATAVDTPAILYRITYQSADADYKAISHAAGETLVDTYRMVRTDSIHTSVHIPSVPEVELVIKDAMDLLNIHIMPHITTFPVYALTGNTTWLESPIRIVSIVTSEDDFMLRHSFAIMIRYDTSSATPLIMMLLSHSKTLLLIEDALRLCSFAS